MMMPTVLTQYRIFIASPGGLEDERKRFRTALEKFSKLHGENRNVVFRPVGWEETVGGVGRPQALINEDLEQCDYAVFVLHDRWGSSTGDRYSSGLEEEWEIAQQLYKENKVRNIALFFKKIDAAQIRDPGTQLQAVLKFKKGIESGKSIFSNSTRLVTNSIISWNHSYQDGWLIMNVERMRRPHARIFLTVGICQKNLPRR